MGSARLSPFKYRPIAALGADRARFFDLPPGHAQHLESQAIEGDAMMEFYAPTCSVHKIEVGNVGEATKAVMMTGAVAPTVNGFAIA
jgi:hypothetical protein